MSIDFGHPWREAEVRVSFRNLDIEFKVIRSYRKLTEKSEHTHVAEW